MNFEETFFDSIVKRKLFYNPKIEIKPVHLANGLFRAVCGCYANDTNQHEIIHPRKNVRRDDVPHAVREMLPTLLGADGTLYGTPGFSSYTLSHVTHITNDNHDRGAGEWLRAILEHGANPSPALGMLHELLMEEDTKRSDELSTLTLPISPARTDLKLYRPKLTTDTWPTSLTIDQATGEFTDPLICAIRAGFDMLACYDAPMARYGGKLDTLRRLTIWGCFALYLHLANTGRENDAQLVPILLCMDAAGMPTLKQASIQSYQWVSRSIDRFFRHQIREQMQQMEEVQWDDDQANEQRVHDMQWKKKRGAVKATRSDEENQRDFLSFYDSYRSETANESPAEAFANAAADLLDRFLSSSPASVARALGVRIGLLTASRRQTAKLYTPEADLLEVLVRASVPPGKEWTLQDMAKHWAEQYGILFGALGDENQRLADPWGISAVAGNEYLTNNERLVDMLEWCGYARRYADGVVLVSVQEMR